MIGTPSAAVVFTDPTFTSVVYRNPSTAQLASLLSIAVPVNLPTPLPAIGNFLDLRLNNFGVRKTDGLDFDINYSWPMSFGAIYADLAGNYVLNFDTQLSPAAPVADSLNLGVSQATARATLGAEVGSLGFAAFLNYRAHASVRHCLRALLGRTDQTGLCRGAWRSRHEPLHRR